MRLTRKQRIVAGFLFFGGLTLLSHGLPDEHWFSLTYMMPSIWVFFMVWVPLSAVHTSMLFDVVSGIIILLLPTLLYTTIVVGALEIWDRLKRQETVNVTE